MEPGATFAAVIRIIGDIVRQRITKALDQSGTGPKISFPEAIHDE
jgi:hypothetical protein